MGFDGVELVMRIEDEFKIVIADDETLDCRTPGALTDLVYSKLKTTEDQTCRSQHDYYLVRKTLIEKLQVPRNSIGPETHLKELVKRAERRERWDDILQTLSHGKNVTVDLTRPVWLRRIIFPLIPVIVLFGAAKYHGYLWSGVLAVLSIYAAMLLTMALRYEFPSKFSRVKDLIRIVGTLSTKTWTREEVFERVKRATTEELGVDETRVTEDADFVGDLGMN